MSKLRKTKKLRKKCWNFDASPLPLNKFLYPLLILWFVRKKRHDHQKRPQTLCVMLIIHPAGVRIPPLSIFHPLEENSDVMHRKHTLIIFKFDFKKTNLIFFMETWKKKYLQVILTSHEIFKSHPCANLFNPYKSSCSYLFS